MIVVKNRQALDRAVTMLEQAAASATPAQIMAAAYNIEQHMASGTYSLLKQTELGVKRNAEGKQYVDCTVTPEAVAAYVAALKAI